jgi:predicted RNase H-like nuclease (RuvC/YqgF family)
VKEKIAEMMKLKEKINEITTSLEEKYWEEKGADDYEKSIESMDRNYIPEKFRTYYASLSVPLQQKFKELLIDIQIYEAIGKVGESLDCKDKNI